MRHGKRVWQSVGPDADVALTTLRNVEHDLAAVALGRSVSLLTAKADEAIVPPAVLLQGAIEIYLDEVRRFRSPKTITACEHMLTLFSSRQPGKSFKDVSRKDLLDHMSALKESGLGDRTIYNHIMRIGTLLKGHGIIGLLSASDKPQYEEKDVEAYDSDQIGALFEAGDAEARMLFEFFLGTGLREQEVMYTTWKNIDFKGRVVAVRSRPELGFKIKDKEERSVPVPDSLIASLTQRKRQSGSMLVFPGRGGKPSGHFIRILQKLALRAG